MIGNGKQPRGRKRRHSDSVLSDIPKEDETPPIKLKRLENEVQLLKERIESQEREIAKLPLEFLVTGGAMDVVPFEQGKEKVFLRNFVSVSSRLTNEKCFLVEEKDIREKVFCPKTPLSLAPEIRASIIQDWIFSTP